MVHQVKTVPTLYNVVTGGERATPRGSSVAVINERFNICTRKAGVPSSREDRGSDAGRISRRNSVTDDSHLTITNFGGNQNNSSMFGCNPDKEPVTVQPPGRPAGQSKLPSCRYELPRF